MMQTTDNTVLAYEKLKGKLKGDSKEKYFKFCSKGEFLCYWKYDPNDIRDLTRSKLDNPEWVIFTRDIKDVKPNYKSDSKRILLELSENMDDVKITCGSGGEAIEWINALRYFKHHYNKKQTRYTVFLPVKCVTIV